MTLERDLQALAGGFPETPELAPRVLAAAHAASLRRRRRRIAVLALALCLLVPATARGVSPDLRHRVLETFGLRNVTVERVRHLPAVSPATARRLELGSPVTLRRARSALGLRVSPPSPLGPADGIFEDALQSGVDVTFVYQPATTAARIGARKRVLVSVVRGQLDKQLIGKMTSLATSVKRYSLDGEPALLITGAPHLLILIRHGNGGIDQTYTRQAGTTILVQRGAFLVRGRATSRAPAWTRSRAPCLPADRGFSVMGSSTREVDCTHNGQATKPYGRARDRLGPGADAAAGARSCDA